MNQHGELTSDFRKVVMTITLWLGYKKFKTTNSPLFYVFYRDGAFYFVALTSTFHPLPNVSSV
jgi:hypothetical protein